MLKNAETLSGAARRVYGKFYNFFYGLGKVGLLKNGRRIIKKYRVLTYQRHHHPLILGVERLLPRQGAA